MSQGIRAGRAYIEVFAKDGGVVGQVRAIAQKGAAAAGGPGGGGLFGLGGGGAAQAGEGFGGLASGLMRFASAALSAKVAFDIIKLGFKTISDVNNLSKQLGTSVGTADWIDRAATASGIDNPKEKIQELRKSIFEAAAEPSGAKGKAFAALGLDAVSLSTKPLADQLTAVGNAFEKIGNESDKAAYAAALFGRNGYEVLGMLKALKQERGESRVSDRQAAQAEFVGQVGKEFKKGATGLGIGVSSWLMGFVAPDTVALLEREVKEREKNASAARREAAAFEAAAKQKERLAEAWAKWYQKQAAAQSGSARIERELRGMETGRGEGVFHTSELLALQEELGDPYGYDPTVRAEIERRRRALYRRDVLRAEQQAAESTPSGKLTSSLRELQQRMIEQGLGRQTAGILATASVDQFLGGFGVDSMSIFARAKEKLAELRAGRQAAQQMGVWDEAEAGKFARTERALKAQASRAAGFPDLYGEFEQSLADIAELQQAGAITPEMAAKRVRELRTGVVGGLEPIRAIGGPAAMAAGSAEVYQTIARASNSSLQTKLQQEANAKLDAIQRRIEGLTLPEPVRLP